MTRPLAPSLILCIAISSLSATPAARAGSCSGNLIISEVVDATLPDGLPKFIELTNTGGSPIDLSAYSIGNFNNGSTNLGGDASVLSGLLASGDSYVISYESGDSAGNGTFFDTYGFDPDNFDLGAFFNGDDVLALYLGAATGDGSNATLCDVYGVIGTDGSGEPWEYTDSYAFRNAGTTAPNATFSAGEWTIPGANALETGDDVTELALILANTSPGTHNGGGAPASVGNESQAEGNSGDSPMTFTLTLGEPAPMGGVTFDVNTVDGTDPGSDATTADGDYDAVALVGATISEGNDSFDVIVTIHGDSNQEADEQFTVEFSNFSGITVPEVLVATGTILNDDASTLDLHEIQGSGSSSPFTGQLVETSEAVVTGVGPEGFTIQTPPDMDDGDPDTSEGLYVFTDGVPSVSIGDHVTVVGTVVEFFGLTRIESVVSTTVTTTHNPLPDPIAFDATTPSSDPTMPSCAIEYECYEGMLVEIESGFVNTGNQGFGSDPIAEVFVSATGARIFREPGLEPASRGSIPSWDGNPELFELDPDRLGLGNQEIFGGSTFTTVGVVGFDFGDYEVWPTSLNVTPATLPRSVTIPSGQSLPEGTQPLRIASFNLLRLFDDIDDPSDTNSQGDIRNDFVNSTEQWNRHRVKAARYIAEVLQAPDIIGVQEVESLTVLQALAVEIDGLLGLPGTYTAHLIEGNDIGTIDVGFLVKETVSTPTITQLFKDDTFTCCGNSPDLTHDRPPLLLEATFPAGARGAALPFAVIVLHNRSLNGADTERVQNKRLNQAQDVAQFAQDFQTMNTDVPLVILGDLNAFEFTDGYVDVVGQIAGDFDPAENTLSGPDLVDPNLVVTTLLLPAAERYSFAFNGSAQTLDHALLSETAMQYFVDLQFGRANVDGPEHRLESEAPGMETSLYASDHDGFVLTLATGVLVLFADDFESGDATAWSASTP